MDKPAFLAIIERYLGGEIPKDAAAAELQALGTPFLANIPEADRERVLDLYLHASWLEQRRLGVEGTSAEPPTRSSILAELSPEQRDLLRRHGLP
jgi:hypothetical protein